MRCRILTAVSVKTVSSIVKMEAPGTIEILGTNLSNHKALDPTGPLFSLPFEPHILRSLWITTSNYEGAGSMPDQSV
jgi:hypothetical protein